MIQRQIETEKNYNEIIEKNNDEIIDLVEKEVEEVENDDGKILMKYQKLALKVFCMKNG